jgi:hypothetical protein
MPSLQNICSILHNETVIIAEFKYYKYFVNSLWFDWVILDFDGVLLPIYRVSKNFQCPCASSFIARGVSLQSAIWYNMLT